MEVEGEEERRETALAGTPLLQAGFKSSKVSQAQLDKFRKLHKLRLQMKESAKERGKRKDRKVDGGMDIQHGDEPAAPALTPKKRQKLYWGLDTKERWERKSNM
ncbi:unnamed protein product [Spirodela intermedia]|uniref:Uncharacterized protein n=1 Tax=Spirodela intermedia TaxID=51605 RepID=A0A7I8JPF1_SPIIN|nr:unnamed protein product [Spirodela intermedia]CAA6671322.1 unnamed protein product [Spirodela intermedia]